MKNLRPILLGLLAVLFVAAITGGFAWVMFQTGDSSAGAVPPAAAKPAATGAAPTASAQKLAEIMASTGMPLNLVIPPSTPVANIAPMQTLLMELDSRKRDLANFVQNSQQLIAQATTAAAGDPVRLQQINSAKSQYDTYIQQRLNEILALESQVKQLQTPARPGPPPPAP